MEQRCANLLTPMQVSPFDGGARPDLWFLTSASPSCGFGHVSRCTILAEMLATRFRPVLVGFADDAWTPAWAGRRGLASRTLGPALTDGTALPVGLIIDTRRDDHAKPFLSDLSQLSVPVLSIHDLGLGLLPSAMVIDGSIDPTPRFGVPAQSEYFAGPDYLVLHPEFGTVFERRRDAGTRVERIIIGLGGGCRRGFFEKVLAGIMSWRSSVEVVGLPGFAGAQRSEEFGFVAQWPSFRWAGPRDSVAELMAACGIAVTAGGLTAYEALAAGTPLIALSYDGHQDRTVKALARRGLCIDLGLGESVTPAAVAAAVSRLNEDARLRRTMSHAGRRAVDGRGAERVAALICRMARVRPISYSVEACCR